MFPFTGSRWLFAAMLLVLGALGCSKGVEQDPAFQQLAKSHEEMEKAYKGTCREVASLNADFQQTQRLEQRVAKLEQALNAMNAAMAAQAKPAAAAPAPQPAKPGAPAPAPAAAAAKPGVPALKPVSAPATATLKKQAADESADEEAAEDHGEPAKEAAPVEKKASARKSASVKKSESARAVRSSEKSETAKTSSETASGARGVYHTVLAGQSLEDIAAKYKTSAKTILADNHLPANFKLVPGQRIFVKKGL